MCDGGVDCPADARQPETIVCRAAVGPCDEPETCKGGIDCPHDAKKPGSFVCRPAAGPCDAPERCTGNGDECPPDAKKPGTHVCRSKRSGCDLAERCPGDGSSDACPADVANNQGKVLKCGRTCFTCGARPADLLLTKNNYSEWRAAGISCCAGQGGWGAAAALQPPPAQAWASHPAPAVPSPADFGGCNMGACDPAQIVAIPRSAEECAPGDGYCLSLVAADAWATYCNPAACPPALCPAFAGKQQALGTLAHGVCIPDPANPAACQWQCVDKRDASPDTCPPRANAQWTAAGLRVTTAVDTWSPV